MLQLEIRGTKEVRYATAWCVALFLVQAGLMSCAAQLDMSAKRVAASDDKDWGIVIGSFLVVPETVGSEPKSGHDASEMFYVFDVIQLPSDAAANYFTTPKYRLEVKPGEERIFVSRLRPGSYLIRDFHEEGIVRLEGEVGGVFTVRSNEVHYIGRLRVILPGWTAKGKAYRVVVENDRESTLGEVSTVYPDLAAAAVNVPIQLGEPAAP